MNLKELLDDLSKAATPGSWNPAPKRLSIPLSNGQVAEGPLMGYLVGDQTTGDGMPVSLGSERVADHRFVAELVNAYRDGELSVRAETFAPDVQADAWNGAIEAAVNVIWEHNDPEYVSAIAEAVRALLLKPGRPLDMHSRTSKEKA